MFFVYKAIRSDEFGLVVTDIRRSVLPRIDPITIDVPGRPGSYYAGHRYGVRQILIDYALPFGTYEEVQAKVRDLAAWLAPDGLRPLELSREFGRYYNAVPVHDSSLHETVFEQGILQFLCPDPFAYSAEVRSQLIAGEADIVLDCSARVWPRLEVTFEEAVTEFQLTNSDGASVRVEHGFGVSDTLAVDFGTGKVTINGQLAMTALDVGSDFFELLPGGNTLSVNVPATVYWRERWL